MMLENSFPPIWKRVIYFLISEKITSKIAQTSIALLFAGLLIIAASNGVSISTIWLVSSIATFIILYLNSQKLKEQFLESTFTGYWLYDNIPEDQGDPPKISQHEGKKRYIQVDRSKNEFRIRGWLEGQGNKLYFETSEVIFVGFGEKEGRLLYKFSSPDGTPTKEFLVGFVVAKWHKNHEAGPIVTLEGRYYGQASGSVGNTVYRKISEDCFKEAVR